MNHLVSSIKAAFLLLVFALPVLNADDDGPGILPPVISNDYVLIPSDLLRVQVFQEDELMREVSVSQNHTISLPLIGVINVKGKTVRELEANITQLYDRDFLVNPQVSVIVLRYAERTVSVLGSVNNPGPVAFPQERGLNLLEAIARANGFSRLADRRRVQLIRTLDDGSTETYVINADRLIGAGATQPPNLMVNDVISVPERIF